MRSDAHLLQESLVAALRTEPLLIPAEELLHSAKARDVQDQLQTSLAQLLDPGQAIAEIDRRQFRELDDRLIDRFRAAMQSAVTGGATLADSERQILESFGLSKVGELRASMQTHLGAPPELPEQTLAIYVPEGDRKQEEFQRALRRDLQALETALEQPDADTGEAELQLTPTVEADQVPAQIQKAGARILSESPVRVASATPASIPVEPKVIADPPAVQAAAEPVDIASDLRATLALEADRQGSKSRGLAKLNPIPMLTAALEAVGIGGEEFGFILRYGRYAPKGRNSQFLIGGLGLADLSRRLTAWLETNGPLEGQVQVIDEGSGELMVYLLLPEAA